MPYPAIDVHPISPVWIIATTALVAFIVAIVVARALWGDVRYDVRRAWCLAAGYFAACFALSIALGVFQELISVSATLDQLSDFGWWAGLLATITVVIIAYGVVWPMGTWTLGRPLDRPTSLGFGLLWGASEGQLFLCIWVILESMFGAGWLVPVVSFVAIASYSALWHSFFWDRYIAPEHNDPAWNFRKILFAHVPSLAATLCFLALTGNALIFVLLQTLALVLSSHSMRMPRWTALDGSALK